MFNRLKLLIPAIVPSWNFFDYISPSPRVQYCLFQAKIESPNHWQEFRPRPDHLTFFQMLKRMLWNSHWNESMFIMGCAERLIVNPTAHSETEILNRIIADILHASPPIFVHNSTHLQFRLVFIEREGKSLTQEITYHSRVKILPDLTVA